MVYSILHTLILLKLMHMCICMYLNSLYACMCEFMWNNAAYSLASLINPFTASLSPLQEQEGK